jgi:protein-tyrosine phosphatase
MPSMVCKRGGTELWVGSATARVPDVDFILNVKGTAVNGERHFPLRDSGLERPERIVAAVKELDRLMRRSRHGVYLHCARGRSRSVIVAAVWLAWIRRRSLRQTLTLVKRRHRSANPNPALVRIALSAVKNLHQG